MRGEQGKAGMEGAEWREGKKKKINVMVNVKKMGGKVIGKI